MKIRIVVLDYDQNYLNRLSSALSAREDCSAEIYSFTEPEQAFGKLQQIDNGIFIVSERFDVDPERVPGSVSFAWFTEKHTVREIKNRPAICKFQKSDHIFRELLSVYSGTYSSEIKESEGIGGLGSGAGVYAFFTCGGGSGASTAAAACAMRFAAIGKTPLYLNLERFGTSGIFFHSETTTRMGDLLYAIKSKRANLSLRLRSAVMQSEEGVYFIESCRAATEVMEMTAEDIGILINELRGMGQFDCIIIDADFLLEGASLEIMRRASANVLVSNGELASHVKLERVNNAMEIISARDEVEFPPTWLLYNNFSSKTGSTDEKVDIAVLGGAPRYEGAPPIRIARQLSKMTFFDELL